MASRKNGGLPRARLTALIESYFLTSSSVFSSKVSNSTRPLIRFILLYCFNSSKIK